MSFIVVYICDLEPKFDTFFVLIANKEKVYLIKKKNYLNFWNDEG